MGFTIPVSKPWVVDVGCGSAPAPFANIVVDKFVDVAPGQRHGELMTEGKFLIEADAARLPFEDGQVEFIYCNHVLEHVENPLAVAAELQRVARKGVLFVPGMRAEAVELTGWRQTTPSEHKWLSWREDTTLCMLRYPPDRPGRITTLMRLGQWPPVGNGMWEEVRACWGWAHWPETLNIKLLQLMEEDKSHV